MFLPRESQGREAWWAAVYGVAQSRTRLKRRSSSSSRAWYFVPAGYNPQALSPLFWAISWQDWPNPLSMSLSLSVQQEKKKSLFEIYVYLFGYTGSQLQHTGSSIFAMACGICSCSTQTLSRGMWDLLLQSGNEPRAPALESRVLATGPPEKSPQNHFLSLL